MNCPLCGIVLHLDKQSKEIDTALCKSKWGTTPKDFFRCKGCNLLRPILWWDALELDIHTEVKLPQAEEVIPEELAGEHEHPWGD